MSRTTPNNIESLPPTGIFVFGSNREGQHGGGAAYTALVRFGAIMGVGEGLQGQSYGLPTMEGIESFRLAASRFIAFARERPDLEFWLTKVGCGIAGYSEEDVRAMFADTPGNVIKPPGW
ncbi:MAG: hypothetical protein ABIR57_05075 [Aeromicrobium sp.]